MPTYTATFFTAADYASRPINAANAQQALELARKAYDEHFSELEFRSHDNIEPLEQIEICNTEDFCDGAFWESDDRRLRQAARDLLEALEDQTEAAQAVIDHWAEGDLAAAVRGLDASIDGARAAIAKAKGGDQ
jgi:hypothetical protein